MDVDAQKQLEAWIAELAERLKRIADPEVRAPGVPCGSHYPAVRDWWEAVARGLALDMDIPSRQTRYTVIRAAVGRRLRSRAA